VRALCVGRHKYLSDHLALFFTELGLEASSVVGLDAAVAESRRLRPDVVICDYDLLATRPLDAWESDVMLSRTPVIAVSLTRRPEDVHLLDVNGIAGALYLPQLDADMARRVLAGIPRATRPCPGGPSPRWHADAPPPARAR
jgi:DNA-binding response OmpR family regulator